MQNISLENKSVQIATWGTFFATVLVTDRLSFEPANLGKMVVLAITAFTLLFISFPVTKQIWKNNKVLSTLVLIFVTSCLISIIFSETMFTRGFYGAFGRSTGFLTYVSLSILLLVSLNFSMKESFSRVIRFFYFAAILNILYSILASLGYDLITWNNTYNKALGTFGNPNFIASFMGIFFGVHLCNFDRFKDSRKKLVLFFAICISAVYVVVLSGSLQGYVLIGYGILLSTFFRLHFDDKRKSISKIFALISLIAGIVAILGVLQKGPLASVLYKPSVTFRGEYWQAAINMAKDHFLFGVGLDSYGLYYRQYRDASAAAYPGLNVVTDAAHNVVLDIFAGAGVFALLAYLGIIVSILVSCFSYFRRLEKFDPLFASLFLGWSSYQIQSIISINQIGLAVWGWLLGGCLLAYTRVNVIVERVDLNPKQLKTQSRNDERLLPPSYVLLLTSGVALGIGAASPSLIADINFRAALTGQTTTVEKVVKVAEAWPQDNFRMERVVVALNNQNQVGPAKTLAAKYALLFPDDFVAWRILYSLSEDGSMEKIAYKERLKELDPLNPEWK